MFFSSGMITTQKSRGFIVRLMGAAILSLAVSNFVGLASLAAQELDLHAIVERDGTVVLCLAKAQLLFADRCAGTGRLTIVQPIQEGEIVWRIAPGKVVIENESPQNPDCALSRAKWDTRDERTISSGKRIEVIDPSWVLGQLDKEFFGVNHVEEGDFDAFALDLDNDGRDEIIFRASNVERTAKLNQKTGGAYPYVVVGGILPKSSAHPQTFYFERGTYAGGTDMIGDVSFKGVVPIAVETGEIALLVATGTGFNVLQDLIRYRGGVVQRIETIQRRCD
jgi:hypothetical protein